MTLLSQQQVRLFDTPPQLSLNERKVLFNMDKDTKHRIKYLRSNSTKICYLICQGYFVSEKRFFTADTFDLKDIRYVIKILSLKIGVKKFLKECDRKLLYRVRVMILTKYEFSSFEKGKEKVISQFRSLLQRSVNPKNNFYSIIDWMKINRIEVPDYMRIWSLISHQNSIFESGLINKVESLLTLEQKDKLNTLLKQEKENGWYPITQYQKIEQGLSISKIQRSINDYLEISEVFTLLLPLVAKLTISQNSWRTYAQQASNFRVSNLKSIDNQYRKYFYLIAFIVHQYSYRNDLFIKIIAHERSYLHNTFKRFEQEHRLEYRNQYLKVLKQHQKESETLEQLWNKVKVIVKDRNKNSDTKISELQGVINDNNSKVSQIRDKQIDDGKFQRSDNDLFLRFIESKSTRIYQRIGAILKIISIDESSSDSSIIKAINEYRTFTDYKFCKENLSLLDYDDKILYISSDKINIKLCRSLLLLHIYESLKSGNLNLMFSYRHQSVEKYFINKDQKWEATKSSIAKENGLEHLLDFTTLSTKLKDMLLSQLKETNENIKTGANLYYKPNLFGKYHLKTPGKYQENEDLVATFFEKYKYVSLRDILFDVNDQVNFLAEMSHRIKHKTIQKKDVNVCVAAIMSYGCNIGYSKMSKISDGVSPSNLKNIIEWYFHKDSLEGVNEKIIQMIRVLPLSKLFQHEDFQQTSSDGQKFDVSVQSLNANYSFKYFGKGKGVTAYEVWPQFVQNTAT